MNTERELFLPSAFLPPPPFYALIKNHKKFFFQILETFPKQTIRNRCYVMGPNSILRLSVPLDHRKNDVKTCDIRIAPDNSWKSYFQKTLDTCYLNSPFYEYYRDDLLNIINKPFQFLIDLNCGLHNWTTKVLGIDAEYCFAKEFKAPEPNTTEYFLFTMKAFNPEKYNTISFKPYKQVFDDVHGFVPHLSIIDLLFNKGPEASNYLVL